MITIGITQIGISEERLNIFTLHLFYLWNIVATIILLKCLPLYSLQQCNNIQLDTVTKKKSNIVLNQNVI